MGTSQTLPSLVDVIPEARLNLVIYYLRQGNISEAYDLMKDIEPSQPNEYILKGVVNSAVGQEQNSVRISLVKISFYEFMLFNFYFENEQKENLKVAQTFYQLVGGSASDCGRFIFDIMFFILFWKSIFCFFLRYNCW